MRIILSADDGKWFYDMSEKEQADYIEEHPASKYAKAHKAKTDAANASSLKPADSDRSKWPTHIQALTLPPAWKDVQISDDPKANLQATGFDAKGRKQYVYSEEFSKSQAAAKFSRILELDTKFDEVAAQVGKAEHSDNAKSKGHAECLKLIMKMGLRPGGEDDTGADKKAYGASTLEARHVVQEGDKTFLRFVGKKGVDIDLEVEDPEIAKMLRKRARASATKSGKLFPEVKADTLSQYAHTLDGGGFKTKDFRTRLGTRTAKDLVEKYKPVPKTMVEYKKAVKDIATKVSKKLGNTPVVALQSYIAPQIFSEWQASLADKT